MFETNLQLQKAMLEQLADALFEVNQEQAMLEQADLPNKNIFSALAKKVRLQALRPQQLFFIGSTFE